VSDDGVRLWVNGQQIINNWTNHAPTENSGTIALTAGQRYDIRMEFFENAGGATARLLWSSASVPKAVVPTARLFAATSGPSPIRINFQPASAPVPAGYLVDAGLPFASRGNGQSYGWNGDNTALMRDRNASGSQDQRYDTLAHLQRPALPDAVWEIAVPNGAYVVRVVSGDASYFDSVFRTTVEGTLTVNGTPTTSTRWIEGTSTVTVSDGRLTIRSGAGASNNKICFVDITPQ
jgi:PA14 domain